jgi:broad specificity phosphatase PhoE
MKPLSIFLIRHGESVGNVDKTIYKTIPDWKIPLTEKGILQAKEAGQKLALLIKQDSELYGNNLFTFYISPWYRARQTSLNLRETLETIHPKAISITKEDPRLREQEWGNFQEDHIAKKIQDERRRFGTFFYRMPDGESGADVYDRITTFIDTMHRDFEKKESSANIIIISHGLAIKAFLTRWFHWSAEDFDQYDTPDNCKIIQMDLQENYRYKLMTELKLYP